MKAKTIYRFICTVGFTVFLFPMMHAIWDVKYPPPIEQFSALDFLILHVIAWGLAGLILLAACLYRGRRQLHDCRTASRLKNGEFHLMTWYGTTWLMRLLGSREFPWKEDVVETRPLLEPKAVFGAVPIGKDVFNITIAAQTGKDHLRAYFAADLETLEPQLLRMAVDEIRAFSNRAITTEKGIEAHLRECPSLNLKLWSLGLEIKSVSAEKAFVWQSVVEINSKNSAMTSS